MTLRGAVLKQSPRARQMAKTRWSSKLVALSDSRQRSRSSSILSTRVADAQIAYTGKGDVARAGRQGWLSRFFSVVSPF
ncbi:flagellar basal body L-ring protein FlgH [Bacillus amyloliquefaciens]|uniref:flagellar basal body L-ring protein FlgH n=1 Tax=Bacillus amyloliquefaciens TaxID=1390 RepID=UPI00255BBE70|nr:flagellar basal body L-ring protein FlgH [Bacillus amyloliquefaciens]WIX29272.1 flagellar basal body L-ring protein FlgH [Bacillus amyloliquefaciens]